MFPEVPITARKLPLGIKKCAGKSEKICGKVTAKMKFLPRIEFYLGVKRTLYSTVLKKKHSRTSPGVQSKEFSLTEQKN